MNPVNELKIPDLLYFWQYVEYWAKIDPKFPSMRYNDDIITCEEFEDQTDQLAKALLHLGIEKGDRIVTVLPPIPEYMLILVAANKIGAITVPMDVRYRHTDFINLIPTLEPKMIVSIIEISTHDDKVNFKDLLKSLTSEVPELSECIFVFLGESDFGHNFEDLLANTYSNDEELNSRKISLDEDDVVLIIWTGGTTGLPKAAMLTNKNIVRMCVLENIFIQKILNQKGVSGRTKLLANLPVSHVGGTVELLGVGIVGGREIIIQDRWSATGTLKTIQDEKIAFYLGSPTMYRMMMAQETFPSFDLSPLKLALISGEVVGVEFMELMHEKFCKTVVNGYGSTEMGPEVTFTDPTPQDQKKITEGYVGKPLPGMELKIVDMEGNSLEVGGVGEVLVRGDLVCKGYFKNPSENKKGFTSDGFIRTGDLGKIDKDGGLWLKGRIKEIIRVGTYTVLPQEIEDLMFQHFPLKLAAGLGMPDEMLGEVVWLAITPKEGESILEEEVLELCKRELANYKVPKKIVFYEIDPNNPPQTRIGKIDRMRIKKELLKSSR